MSVFKSIVHHSNFNELDNNFIYVSYCNNKINKYRKHTNYAIMKYFIS